MATTTIKSINTTSINFTSLCLEAARMISSPGFQSVLLVAIVESIFASIFNSYLMYMIGKVSVFHANLRWLLIHHSFNLLLFSLANSIKAAYILSVWFLKRDACLLVTALYDCKIQELILIVPLVNGVYSLIALCLERTYATVRYRTYDRSTKAPYLALCLIPLVWLIVLLNQCLPLMDIPRSKYMPVCSNLMTISPSVALTVLVQNFLVEGMAVVLALALYFVNDRLSKNSMINRQMHTLAARFQVAQNVTVNKLLLPTVLLHAFCFVAQYIYLLLVTNGLDLDQGTKMLLIHVNYVFILSYAVAHPSLAFARNPHLKKICLEQWTLVAPGFLKSKTGGKINNAVGDQQQNAMTQANVHFRTLENMWTTVEAKRKR